MNAARNAALQPQVTPLIHFFVKIIENSRMYPAVEDT
jgi:hypothetical protein